MRELFFEKGERGGGVGLEVEMGQEIEEGVGAEEGFGNGEAAVGGVVEGSLKPLSCGCVEGVLRKRDDEAGEAANPLGIDGVALVGHGRRADLGVEELFGELSLVSEEADVSGEFMAGGGKGAEGVYNLDVNFACVGLSCNGKEVGKAEIVGDELFEFFDFGGVVVKEGEKGGLGAGGAFSAEKREVCNEPFEFLGVEEKVLEPEAGPFADGGGLGALEVGVAEARIVGVFFRKKG